MLNLMKSKIKYAALLPLFVINHNAMAQCIDTDGDGWGWDGSSSCQIEVTDSVCVDSPPVGDGWGWNGVESCTVTTVGSTPANSVNTTQCVDTDGDGWGWNESTRSSCLIEALAMDQAETAICIDLDGDGWGWNGSETCTLEAETLTPTGADLQWKVCGLGADIDDGEIIGTGFLSSGYPVSCIRQCSEGVGTVALPDYPGWGYDNELGMQCVITEDLVEYDEVYERHSVPVYVADEEPRRLAFEDQLLYPLHTGNGIWECNEQSRDGIDESFSNIGSTQYFQFTNIPFEDDSELRIWNANTGQGSSDYITGEWSATFPGSNYATEVPYLSLRSDSAGFESVRGYMQIDGDNLKMYQNPFSRQSCQRTPGLAQVNLPSTFEQVESLVTLTLNELRNMPLQCTAFERINYRGNFSPLTSSINRPYDTTPIDVNVQFSSTDDMGVDRFQITEPVVPDESVLPSTYSVSEDSLFFTGYSSALERVSISRQVEFKQFGQGIIMMDRFQSGWQVLSEETTLYHCE